MQEMITCNGSSRRSWKESQYELQEPDLDLDFARRVARNAMSAERRILLETKEGTTRLLVGGEEVDSWQDSDAPNRRMWWNTLLLERACLVRVALEALALLGAHQRGYIKGLKEWHERRIAAEDDLQRRVDAIWRQGDMEWGWASRLAEEFRVSPSKVSRRRKISEKRFPRK